MSGHRILVASILCLFGFCLLAQRPVQKTQKKASESSAVQKKDTAASARKSGKKEEPKQKSKVYLLHSDVLRKRSTVRMYRW